MAETYQYSKAKARPRLIRENIYTALALVFIAVVVGQYIGEKVGWW